MTRRALAVLSLLALAACYGRVSAYATSPSADPHACCRGDASRTPSQAPSLSECCATPAATAAVRVVQAPFAVVAVVAPPILAVPSAVSDAALEPAVVADSPPFLRAVPARAPPLG